MERLTPHDAAFLALEDHLSAMHSGTVAVFDGPEPGFDDLLERVGARVESVPRFRQRVVALPLRRLTRPAWIDDPSFAIDYHVRHTALPAGGGVEALHRLVGRLLSQRLDRGKPLWELWMVSGLDEGRWALVSKVHHAMVDGVSGTDVMSIVLDQSPHATYSPLGDWAPAPIPTPFQLGAAATTDVLTNPIEQARSFQWLVDGTRRAMRDLVDSAHGSGGGLLGPIGTQRRWTSFAIDLDPLRPVRDRNDASTNDIVLALVTGGFRHLLTARSQELPATLRCLVPIAVEGNHMVTTFHAELPVGTAEPLRQLEILNEATGPATDKAGAVAHAVLGDVPGFIGPTLAALGVRVATRAGIEGREPHTIAVHAPGVRRPLSLLEAPMVDAFPATPLAARVRLSVGVFSYADRLSFGITADYDAADQLGLLRDGIELAAADLGGA